MPRQYTRDRRTVHTFPDYFPQRLERLKKSPDYPRANRPFALGPNRLRSGGGGRGRVPMPCTFSVLWAWNTAWSPRFVAYRHGNSRAWYSRRAASSSNDSYVILLIPPSPFRLSTTCRQSYTSGKPWHRCQLLSQTRWVSPRPGRARFSNALR